MANFFYAIAVYPNGETAHFSHRLYFLGGQKDEEGHQLLARLCEEEKLGIISKLWIEYES